MGALQRQALQATFYRYHWAEPKRKKTFKSKTSVCKDKVEINQCRCSSFLRVLLKGQETFSRNAWIYNIYNILPCTHPVITLSNPQFSQSLHEHQYFAVSKKSLFLSQYQPSPVVPPSQSLHHYSRPTASRQHSPEVRLTQPDLHNTLASLSIALTAATSEETIKGDSVPYQNR